MIKAIVGAGGKTSLLKKCAKEYRDQGFKVFVTTSTHMFIEEDTLLTDDADEIIRMLEEKHYAMAGTPFKNKIKALSPETYEKVCQHADVVLIEADGSKHMPIKFPNQQEPVIYNNVEEIIVVCGLHALHRKASEVSHRLELVKQCLQIEDDTKIEAAHIQQLVMKGYVEPMRENYTDKTIKIKPNHNGSLYQRALARLMEEEVDVSILKEEWFSTQPQLFVCGGGHVSNSLVQMASHLDFYIKVMDDRPEFANKERFPMAQEVICDTFDNLENYMEPNAYYAVISRGHKDDFECVKKILQKEHQYLGMIGSKLKVKATFEKLLQAGASQEQIDSIYAPIGLDIKAATPAEIAVSILAQMILVKNSKQCAYASRELLQVKEHGTLCIIIEKKGSSPRGVGSMMFVAEDRIIDSIGGGPVEYAVIQDARANQNVMVREYSLNNEESRKLGMICGGINKVLFIPV